ncbi:MAG: RnfABCDGE type electron transport complex subunit C [Clostridium sp.]|nr:RnfABCDGE type electron transport complex subunit C [Clostridium sp.]MCM1444241.1 RnfABCDGE type electron transport complex subunit C [Candidatus Amulumruptor caecigallinarius]
MITGLKLPRYKSASKNGRIGFYNKPNICYIPLISGEDTDVTIAVKKGDYVYKGSVVGRRKGDFKIPINSSVSGTVIDYQHKTYLNGEKVQCVVIENDFKEKEEIKPVVNKKINNYTHDEFIDIIKNCGVVGMGGSAFPTYLKYDTNEKINTLIINCVECAPYSTCDYVLLSDRCEEILETIDTICEINQIDNAIIAINKKDTGLMEVLNQFIGTYLKIKVVTVPDIYPMGWERNLIKYVCNIDYKDVPSEKGIVVNNVSTIYAIYEALKYNKPLCERIITFTGNGIKKPQNVYVKVGTPIKEIIKKIGTTANDVKIIAGNPLTGKYIEDDDLVATSNLCLVIVLQNIKTIEQSECIKCGKCIKYCPVKIAPIIIRNNMGNKEKQEKLKINKCIECGLCSYVCPVGIDLKNSIVNARGK